MAVTVFCMWKREKKGKVYIIRLRVSSFHEINTHSAKQEESKNDIQALRSRICATDPFGEENLLTSSQKIHTNLPLYKSTTLLSLTFVHCAMDSLNKKPQDL